VRLIEATTSSRTSRSAWASLGQATNKRTTRASAAVRNPTAEQFGQSVAGQRLAVYRPAGQVTLVQGGLSFIASSSAIKV